MRRLATHVLPALALLLALSAHARLVTAAHALLFLLARALALVVMLAGGGGVWWALRAYQLRTEQELSDQAWAKFRFLQRYRNSSAASSSGGASAAAKRLPIGAHLRTVWGLPPEVGDELALTVQLAIRDYVAYWYQPLSPANDDFPADLRLLLADLLGALAARVLELDSSQALAIAASTIEILRLHLGWFREAYAQLGEDAPELFEGGGGDAGSDDSALLQRRQAYVADFVLRSPFLHPGCAAAAPPPPAPAGPTPALSGARKPPREAPEVLYLRHVAAQVLAQLKPELGYQYDASVFVSLVMNLLREAATFKILRPMAEYAQQRYANELVLAALQALAGDKDATTATATATASVGHHSAGSAAASSLNALSTAASSSISGVGGMTLNKFRSTKSFLYKATKRSSEQAEAAFQAVVDAVNAAASTAGPGSAEPDEWPDHHPLSDAALSMTPPLKPRSSSSKSAAVASMPERKTHFAAPFSLNDRLSLARGARLKTPRAFLPGGSGGSKAGGGGGGHNIDDLKNIKANIGSSLNKVKRRFRTLSGHPNDPETPSGGGGGGFPSTQAAARLMMKKPGMLLQKALRRSDAMSPLSPTDSLDDVLTPPPLFLDDDDFALGDGDLSDPPTPPRATGSMAIDELMTADADTVVVCEDDDADGGDDDDDDQDDDEEGATTTQQLLLDADSERAAGAVRERVVELLAKAVASYVRMCVERPEMRSSARARELFEFLSAMEDVFLLGYGDATSPTPTAADSSSDTETDAVERSAARGRRRSQQYWHFLAQDRPETPFLNAHWRFVASKCPECADSELLCSTRGVQWVLVALESGMLWEYVTALHLHPALTARFYDPDESVFRDGKLMESVLQSLFQLKQVAVALEIPRLLGRKDEMDEAFGVSRAGHSSSSSTGAVCVLESVWEVERYVPIQGWTKTQDRRWQELPSSEWVWDGDWALDGKDAVAVNSSIDSALALEAAAASGDLLWEYAKTFEDRFHDKEKKFDSVRRRKWVRRRRQLPCVLSSAALRQPASSLTVTVSPPVSGATAPLSLSSKPTPSSPPALFGAASLPVAPAATVVTLGAAGKVRNVKHFFDLSKRVRAKTDDTAVASPSLSFARRPLMKRRSNSFDKTVFPSPIADLALALESPMTAPLAPEKTVSPDKQKKKRRSIPSLRRSTTAEKDAKGAAPALVRSTTAGSTGAMASERSANPLDSDGDDEDKRCFRCLEAATAAVAGGAAASFSACPSCQQHVCGACRSHLAFLVFPPPLEASRKVPVCGACYERLTGKYRLRVEARVSKCFLRDSSELDGVGVSGDGSDTEPTNVAPASKSPPKFEVVVFVKDKPAAAWSVVRAFADFEALEKQLHEKLRKQEKKHGAGCQACHWKGVDYSELRGVAPSLRTLPIAALSYDKRLVVLEAFVQSVLASDTLGQSPAVQKFLRLSNAASAVASRLHPFSPTTAAALRRGASAFDARTESSVPGDSAAGSAHAATGAVLMESGRWRKGKWVAPETSSKETKVRLLQKLEVSLFAVVGEVFEFDGIGLVRRQLFAMTRSFVKAFLSASHFRKLEKQFLSFTDPKKVAAAIVAFREYMFPAPDAPALPAPPAPLSAAEMQALRKDTLDAILASFPPTLVSLFGETSCENAALKLHEFVQHEVFVKNLLFSVADEVLQQIFPDFALFRPTPAAAGAVSSVRPAR
ncbi:hypothetical protein PybrP1_008095 [[Pythium] brassicae (nom. inval.)]|nr:hypothetical protein PybrP1_008095 [[Pythium] brassicae (nom. inval.)]